MSNDYKARIQLDAASVDNATKAMGLATAGTQALSRAMSGDLIGAMQAATVAMNGLKLAAKANVWLLVATAAITAASVIRGHFIKASEEAEKKLAALRDEMKRVQDQIDKMRGRSSDPIEMANFTVQRGSTDFELAEAEKQFREQARFQEAVRQNALKMGDAPGAQRAELESLKNAEAAAILNRELGRRAREREEQATARAAEESNATQGRQAAERDLKFSRADTTGKIQILEREVSLLEKQAKATRDVVEAENARSEALRKQIELDSLRAKQAAEWTSDEEKQQAWENEQQAARDKAAGKGRPSGGGRREGQSDAERQTARNAGLEDEFTLMYQQQARRGTIRMRGSRPSAFGDGDGGAGFRSRLLPSGFARNRQELDERRNRETANRGVVIRTGDEQPVDIGQKAMKYLKDIAENTAGAV